MKGNNECIQNIPNDERNNINHYLANNKKSNLCSTITNEKNILFTLCRPSSVMAEYFKVIRTILLNLTSKNKAKTILVTSVLPKEGKTFFCSNLAVSIAQSFDKHVLLIDADLKKPSLQRYFSIKQNKGLTDYFKNKDVHLSLLINKTQIPKLSIIGSGSSCHNSSELVSSESMSNLISELKHRYNDRYVIFDSAPLQMSDTLSLASKVDTVILVIKAKKTSKKLVKQTIQNIGKSKILGVVLNHCKVDVKNNYYSNNVLSI
jgi:exopolysaccharide/PEP-CTERM locus tyrosine autokinase